MSNAVKGSDAVLSNVRAITFDDPGLQYYLQLGWVSCVDCREQGCTIETLAEELGYTATAVNRNIRATRASL